MATNHKELDPKRHVLRVRAPSPAPQPEQSDLDEEDYDPEAHIAVGRRNYRGAIDFYRQYDDRMDFRDLLNAALHAAYGMNPEPVDGGRRPDEPGGNHLQHQPVQLTTEDFKR